MEENNQNVNTTPPISPIVQTPPVETPPVSKTKSRLPVLIIGIILFLLIAGSSAGFYIFKQQSSKLTVKPTPTPPSTITTTPTSDSTANWKTYSGSGFEFKYPSEFSLQATQSGIKLSKKLILPTNCPDCLDTATLTINIGKDIENQTLEVAANNAYKLKYSGQTIPQPLKFVTMAGLKVLTVPIGMYENGYYLFINNRLINIETVLGYGSIDETIAQILSTFKFTN